MISALIKRRLKKIKKKRSKCLKMIKIKDSTKNIKKPTSYKYYISNINQKKRSKFQFLTLSIIFHYQPNHTYKVLNFTIKPNKYTQ
jgi:hypothetical protein